MNVRRVKIDIATTFVICMMIFLIVFHRIMLLIMMFVLATTDLVERQLRVYFIGMMLMIDDRKDGTLALASSTKAHCF